MRRIIPFDGKPILIYTIQKLIISIVELGHNHYLRIEFCNQIYKSDPDQTGKLHISIIILFYFEYSIKTQKKRGFD